MATDPTKLAQLIRQHRPKFNNAGFPAWLRARVAEHVLERRAQGAMLSVLSGELGVSSSTLSKWFREHQAPDVAGFLKVVATPPTPPDQPAPPDLPVATAESAPATICSDACTGQHLQLVSAHGFSLHGLSMEQALYALAVLR
jgi:transposase-like protein